MSDPIVDRIVRASGVPELFDVLAERLSPTDLQSLLLAVYRRRASRLAAADVLRQYERSRAAQPAALAPSEARSLDELAASLLPEYEWLELSPVAPLAAVTALAGLSQDVAVATVRGGEVVSDATNVLALEAARRRRRDRGQPVRLAASHRVLRVHAPDAPTVHPHFRLLGLVAAGRAVGSFSFESSALLEQLDFHVRLLAAAGAAAVRVDVTALEGTNERLAADVADELRRRHAHVSVRLAPERTHGRGYYVTACFELHADDLSVVDGGFVTWTQRLLADRKERLLISGAGVERLASLR